MNNGFQQFLNRVAPEIAHRLTAVNEAYWRLTTRGAPEDEEAYIRQKGALLELFSNREDFETLRTFRDSGEITDQLQARQLTILYHHFLRNQIDRESTRELVRREAEIESRFTNFRAAYQGRKVSNNDLAEILLREKRSDKRREAWEAGKQIGREVAEKIRDLVKFRNRIARNLGFADFYSMSLSLEEMDETELFATLKNLEELTGGPFAGMKSELDETLAAGFGVRKEEIQPWHYSDPFFQEVPPTGEAGLDGYFAGKGIVELGRRFYRGIGLEVDDILARSDLFEREGKDQHAYSTDIDREGDVRVLTNLRPTELSMNTLLHELGHAVYSKYIDRQLPYLLRDEPHLFVTEAIAMMMGRLTRDPDWLKKVLNLKAEEVAQLTPALAWRLRLGELIFIRWGLVVVYFERELYRDPDQDLDTLWWDLAERLQYVKRPEGRKAPDWAAKIHIGTTPVYYQNYILGAVAASQIQAAIQREVGAGGIAGNREAGRFLVEKIFRPGAAGAWNDLLRKATGQPLTPEYFVKQFVA